jgi:dienelactone hydrolase
MTELILFHHAQGLTTGVRELAATLESAGHVVHLPDLYEGRTFPDLESGLGFARETGFGTVVGRGVAAGEAVPAEVVYVGYSLGVMPAQQLAQTRPGARGAVLLESCVPAAEFGGAWPASVPLQVHGADEDPIFAGEGDLDAARELVASAPDAELFVYPGKNHLFADSSLPTYDAGAAELLTERVLRFLARVS